MKKSRYTEEQVAYALRRTLLCAVGGFVVALPLTSFQLSLVGSNGLECSARLRSRSTCAAYLFDRGPDKAFEFQGQQSAGAGLREFADIVDEFDRDLGLVLAYARLSVSDDGGVTLDPEHFLLGLLRHSPTTVGRFAAQGWTTDRLERGVSMTLKGLPKPAEGATVLGSRRTIQLLSRARSNSQKRGGSSLIRMEDLLWALTADNGPAGRILRDAGITSVNAGPKSDSSAD
jgi:hypothetical protein